MQHFNKDSSDFNYYAAEYDITNLELAKKRLVIINRILLLLSVYLFYSDYSTLKAVNNLEYRQNIFLIHVCIVIVAIIYLVLFKNLSNFESKRIRLMSWFFIHLYIALALSVGVGISHNSIKVVFNINIYITIIMFLSVYIPSKIIPTLVLILSYHIIFLLSMSRLLNTQVMVAMNQVNSTVAIVISIAIYFTLNNYRRAEFFTSKKLAERENNMNKLFEINPLPLVLADIKSEKIIMMNKKAKEHFKVKTDNVSDITITDYLVNKRDRNIIADQIVKYGKMYDYIIETNRNSQHNWIMCNFELIRYEHRSCILISIIDITKIKLIENELTLKASIDPLTGILNRRKGMELLEYFYNQANEGNTFFSIVFCDINSLKAVNDNFGHTEGDKLISIIADNIKENIHLQDIVFRYGGDEIIILLLNADEEACNAKMNKINKSLKMLGNSLQTPYDISISYGIYNVRKGCKVPLSECIKIADNKMYINKGKYYKIMKNNSNIYEL